MSLKILTFIDAFNPDSVGGAAKVFFEVNRALKDNGETIDVICRSEASMESLNKSGFSFYSYKDNQKSLNNSNQLLKLLYYRKSIVKLFDQYIVNNRPDLIIIHSSSAVFGLKSKLKKINIPILYYFHSPWHKEYEIISTGKRVDSTKKSSQFYSFLKNQKIRMLSKLRKSHESKYLQLSSLIITLSQSMQNILKEEHPKIANRELLINPGAANNKIFWATEDYTKSSNTLPLKSASGNQAPRHLLERSDRSAIKPTCGIEEAFLQNGKKDPLNSISDDNYFLIITSRRLVPRTGVDTLINAFSIIKKVVNQKELLTSFSGVKLIITGKGESLFNLKKLAKELDIEDDILFTGYVEEEVLAKYYRCSDLFVMPTKYLEGFGLSTVEAMASGLPVIGTNIGGTPEILNNISDDLIINQPTKEAIADKIIEFIEKDNLDNYRIKSLKCFKKYYTWDKHIKRLYSSQTQLL